MKKNICLQIVLGLMALKEGKIYARPYGGGAFHPADRQVSGFSGRSRVPQTGASLARTTVPIPRDLHSPTRSGGQGSHSFYPSSTHPSSVQNRPHSVASGFSPGSVPVRGHIAHSGVTHHSGDQGWANSTNDPQNAQMHHGVQNVQGLPGTANFSAEGISAGGLVGPLAGAPIMAGMAGFSDPVPVPPMPIMPPVPVAVAPMMPSVAQPTPIVPTPDPILGSMPAAAVMTPKPSAPSLASPTTPSDAAMMGSSDLSTPVLSPSITDSVTPSDPSAALTVPTPDPSLTSTPPSDPSVSLANPAPSDTPSPDTSSPEAASGTAGVDLKTEPPKPVVKKANKKPPSLSYVKPVKAFCVDGSAIGNVAAVQEGRVLGPQVLEIEYSDTPQGQSGFRNLALACSKKTPPSTLNIERLKVDLRRLHYRSNPIISHANEKLTPEVGNSTT